MKDFSAARDFSTVKGQMQAMSCLPETYRTMKALHMHSNFARKAYPGFTRYPYRKEVHYQPILSPPT